MEEVWGCFFQPGKLKLCCIIAAVLYLWVTYWGSAPEKGRGKECRRTKQGNMWRGFSVQNSLFLLLEGKQKKTNPAEEKKRVLWNRETANNSRLRMRGGSGGPSVGLGNENIYREIDLQCNLVWELSKWNLQELEDKLLTFMAIIPPGYDQFYFHYKALSCSCNWKTQKWTWNVQV